MWHDPILAGSSAGFGAGFGYGYGPGFGPGSGDGYGSGDGDGDGFGDGPGSGPGSGDGSGYGCGCGAGFGDGPGSGPGSGDGSGDGSGYGCGCGAGFGSGDGFGDGPGDGDGSARILVGGRLYKLVDAGYRTPHGFTWPPTGPVEASGPFSEALGNPCPSQPGDGLCVGLTQQALTSGGLEFAPPNRLLLVEVDPADVLGSDAAKLRAKRVTVVREATPDEWVEVGP